jgi:hypothetical protein
VRSACTVPHIVPTQHLRYWAGMSSPHLRCGAGVGRHTWAGVLVSFQGCSECWAVGPLSSPGFIDQGLPVEGGE